MKERATSADATRFYCSMGLHFRLCSILSFWRILVSTLKVEQLGLCLPQFLEPILSLGILFCVSFI